MKKALIGLALATAGFSAHANVLCNIITKSPRYDVSSYVRSQTACVTTTHAARAGATVPHVLATVAAVVVVGLVVKAVVESQTPAPLTEDELAKIRCLCDDPKSFWEEKQKEREKQNQEAEAAWTEYDMKIAIYNKDVEEYNLKMKEYRKTASLQKVNDLNDEYNKNTKCVKYLKFTETAVDPATRAYWWKEFVALCATPDSNGKVWHRNNG